MKKLVLSILTVGVIIAPILSLPNTAQATCTVLFVQCVGFVDVDPANIAIITTATASTTTAAATSTSAAANVSQAAATGLAGSATAVVAPLIAAIKACDVAFGTLSDLLDMQQFDKMGLLGVSPHEAVAIQAKIVKLQAAVKCREAVLTKAQAINVTLVDISATHKITTQVSDDINQLNQRIEFLKARMNQSTERVMKAIAVQILVPFVQVLTTSTINKWVSKLVDPSVLRTAQVLKNQVYSIEDIRQRYPDSTDQAIIYNLANDLSGQAPAQVAPLIQTVAESNLSNCQNSTQSFNQQMYCYGVMTNNDGPLSTLYWDKANGTAARSQSAANIQVVRDAGFRSVNECNDSSYAQNQKNQAAMDVAAREVNNTLDTYYELKDGGAAQSEIDKADSAHKAALAKMKAIPQTATGDWLAAVCTGVSNPGRLASDLIKETFVNSNNEVAQLQKDNLPAAASFVKNLLGNMLNSILHGNKPSSKVLTQTGLSAATIAAPALLNSGNDLNSVKDATDNNPDNPNGKLVFTAKQSQNTPQTGKVAYVIAWDAQGVPNAGTVAVIGDAIPNGEFDTTTLTGQTEVQLDPGSFTSFKIEVRDSSFQLITSNEITVNTGTVAGISTSRAVFSPRGPAMTNEVSLR